ncbi:hypothetical protein SISSUDRAFT_406089 [Sistotremastrum suecicum HHB10207 ss-3]|uniref:G protein-coupled receptor GPR1/2/3 C-terminal domain-containing protein n=1 Tax=Sistotremastrum suecicum HHB10207 ss-3 TaxID=1314776 RepID=A0A165YQT5_9AGAM|nr:hypothetical protein SISSUDRAFT_406089 [Sistotremastrum suecicum HHB10207 ss-3]
MEIDISTGPLSAPASYSFAVRVGLTLKVQMACISTASILGLFTYFLIQIIRARLSNRPHTTLSHFHAYLVSILCAELFEATSSIMIIQWIQTGHITEGPYCTAEGITRVIGSAGLALGNLAMAVSTWGCVVREWSPPSLKITAFVTASIWIFVLSVVMINYFVHAPSSFYGSTVYWCFIRPPYTLPGAIALVYVWYWIVAGCLLLVYTSIAIKIMRDSTNFRAAGYQVGRRQRSMRKVAFQMIWYPVFYLICVLPTNVMRLWQFSHPDHPPSGTGIIISGVFLSSSGFLNVMLYCITRPSLIHFHREIADSGSPPLLSQPSFSYVPDLGDIDMASTCTPSTTLDGQNLQA